MKKLIITLAIALAACTAAFAQKGLSVGVGYQSYKRYQDSYVYKHHNKWNQLGA